MDKNRVVLTFSVLLVISLSLACGISFSGPEEDISIDQAVALTVAALDIKQPTQPPPTDTPSPQATEGPTPTPSPTPLPCNRPDFQSETIPDDSEFDPGDTFTKSWTIKNDGTCTWNTNYKFVFVSGDRMGGATSQNLTENIEPGETETFSVNLTAPDSDGEYKGYWKLQADDGGQFGNYWVQVIVGEPEPDILFAVTSVSIGGDQIKVGFCPHTFNFNADITTNAAGQVKYHWVFSNGTESEVKSLNFDSAGTKNVTYSRNFGCGGAVCPYGVQIYIDEPNHQYLGTWQIVAQCF